MIWQAFTFKYTKFLAVAKDHGYGNVHIIDSEGNDYGSYRSIARFKKFAQNDGGIPAQRLGKARVSIVATS